MRKKKQYMTATEAAAALEVSRATLYSYVSRGLIRSEPSGEGVRRHRYHAQDVRVLLARKAQRRDPSLVVERALHFGAPVLASSLTLIDGERYYYRGEDALQLATSRSVEEVASFMWSGDWSRLRFDGAEVDLSEDDARAGFNLTTLERFQRELPLAGAADLAAYDLRTEAVWACGSRILALLTTVAAGVPLQSGIVSTLLRGWNIRLKGAERLLTAALILCADHELNVSSFTARCVASARSTPYQVVQAGLAALQGTRHGGHTARVAALLDEVREPSRARDALGERLRRGEQIPGFGHPLYAQGDPRARLLLRLIRETAAEAPSVRLAHAVTTETARLVGQRPTIDFALATLARLFDRPRDGALTIFALGRTIGWIGHAIEQYETDQMIRPRARYEGPLPDRTGEDTVAT